MAHYWPDDMLDRVTPPQVMDDRGRATLRALDGLFADMPLQAFAVRDADTCPASALPALIAERSMEEFIDPALPEHVQRRILKNAWRLQQMAGYDDGVKLGLQLLGMTAEIIHWHQLTPKGTPNTHRIHVRVEEVLFPGDDGYFGPKQLSATQRMIESTKRFSQETEIEVAASANGQLFMGAMSNCVLIVVAGALPPVIPATDAPASVGAVSFFQIIATA